MLKSLQVGLLGLVGILASVSLSPIALSQPANFPKNSYRLQTQFTGNRKCLDIVNDGNNNRRFKSEVHHPGACTGGAHGDNLMFSITKRNPHELLST